MQKVRQNARTFREENKLPFPIELKDLQKLSKENDWILSPYSKAKRLIDENNLQEYVKAKKAFTYTYNGDTAILYDDNISYEDKMFCICHEIGHIELQHSCTSGILGKSKNNKEQNILEKEADVFALDTLAPSYLLIKNGLTSVKNIVDKGILNEQNAVTQLKDCYSNRENPLKKRHIKQFIAVSLSLTILSGIGLTVYNNVEMSQTVYITKTGDRYHKEDCYHLKGHDSFPVSLYEALEKNLTPCKTCFK